MSPRKVKKTQISRSYYLPLETWPWLPHLYYHCWILYPPFSAPEIRQTKIYKMSIGIKSENG